MKIIEYNIFNKKEQSLLIENYQDFETFLGFFNKELSNDLKNYLNYEPTKKSHCATKTNIMLATKFLELDLKKENWINIFNNLYKLYIENILKALKNDKIIINKNGSYNSFKDFKRIMQNKKYIVKNYNNNFLNNKNYYYIENSNYLILENDPKLDDYILKNFNNYKYSYILNLRNIKEKELNNYIKDFVSKTNNPELLIYTSGTDIKQMKKYFNICINNNIKIFNITFSNFNIKDKKWLKNIKLFLNQYKNKIILKTNLNLF